MISAPLVKLLFLHFSMSDSKYKTTSFKLSICLFAFKSFSASVPFMTFASVLVAAAFLRMSISVSKSEILLLALMRSSCNFKISALFLIFSSLHFCFSISALVLILSTTSSCLFSKSISSAWVLILFFKAVFSLLRVVFLVLHSFIATVSVIGAFCLAKSSFSLTSNSAFFFANSLSNFFNSASF